jgi:hypothetical protein
MPEEESIYSPETSPLKMVKSDSKLENKSDKTIRPDTREKMKERMQSDKQLVLAAEATKVESMKMKVDEMRIKQEKQAYRNMNLERMRLILLFAYSKKFG